MGKLITVKRNNYHFYIDGKNIYIRLPGTIPQQFLVETIDYKKLSDHDFMNLIDDIYRQRINDHCSFEHKIFSRYRLTPTARELT